MVVSYQFQNWKTQNRFDGLEEKEAESQPQDNGKIKPPDDLKFTQILTKKQRKKLKQKQARKQSKAAAEPTRQETTKLANEEVALLAEGLVSEILPEFFQKSKDPNRSSVRPSKRGTIDVDNYSDQELMDVLLWLMVKSKEFYADCEYNELVNVLSSILKILLQYLPKCRELEKAACHFRCFRAVAYLYLQEYDSAVKDATDCIAINNRSPLPYQIRAQCYRCQGKENQALRDTYSAVSIDPELLRPMIE